MSGYRSDRARVEGLGGAKHGAGTWIKERVSSVALIPLALWGLWSVTRILPADGGESLQAAALWMQVPLNAVLLALLVLVSLYHMHLGMRVIVEDYVHRPISKGALLLVNLFVCVALAAAAVFSILKVALGA